MAWVFYNSYRITNETRFSTILETPISSLGNYRVSNANKPKKSRRRPEIDKDRDYLLSDTPMERFSTKDIKMKNLRKLKNFTKAFNILNKRKEGENEDDGNLISTLNDHVMESILDYLSYKDLISLSETSKTMLFRVQTFALHYVSSHLRMKTVNNFFARHLLTSEEMMIRKRFARDKGPKIRTSLVAFRYLKHYGNFIERSSITTAVVVNRRNQFQKQRYIIRELSEPLGRDVLRLKQICGLHFKKRFCNVPAGRYQISIHIQIRGNLDRPGRPRRWNNNCTTILTATDEYSSNDDRHLAQAAIEPQYWKKIQKNKFDNELLGGNARVEKDENSLPEANNWFYVALKPFNLKNVTNNLIFEWTDMETTAWKDSGRWKEGMCWDFVQIKEL